MPAVIKFDREGRVRAVWDDGLARFLDSAFGKEVFASRRRASVILTVECGPLAGHFYADMSLLADLTANDAHRCCLWPPRRLEAECKQDEVLYVNREFVVGLR